MKIVIIGTGAMVMFFAAFLMYTNEKVCRPTPIHIQPKLAQSMVNQPTVNQP